MIPTRKMTEWQIKYATWNRFIIDTFLTRYSELLTSFNDISFKNMDERLLDYLKKYQERQETEIVKLTHLQLARELGTTRVIISRLLKTMEKSGQVDLQRGLIELKKL